MTKNPVRAVPVNTHNTGRRNQGAIAIPSHPKPTIKTLMITVIQALYRSWTNTSLGRVFIISLKRKSEGTAEGGDDESSDFTIDRVIDEF
jgi:hypothetical protein